MNTIIENKLIVLNSKDSTKLNGSYNSQLYYPFKHIFSHESNNDVYNISVSLLNCEIPASFYNVNVYNNVLKYQVGTTTYTLTMTTGNYNATTFQSEFLTQFSAGGSAANLTVSFSTTSGKLTFTETTGNDVSFLITDSETTMGEVLGLDDDFLITTYGVTCSYMLNLLGETMLKICSPSLTYENFDSYSSLSNHLIHTIPVSVKPYSLITFQNNNKGFHLIKEKFLNALEIEIRDGNNNLVNFNNANHSITLLLQIEKKIDYSIKQILDLAILNEKEQEEKQEEKPEPEPEKKNIDLEELKLLES